MKNFYFILFIILSGGVMGLAQESQSKVFHFSDYSSNIGQNADTSTALHALFEAVKRAKGGKVIIPPGTYYLAGDKAIPLTSNTSVEAYGANFYLPKHLGDQARLVLFHGQDIRQFSWQGGHFWGYVFDHLNPPNTWEPNVTTRIFVVNTSESGTTDRLTFRDILADGIAGAVINVEGNKRSESVVHNFATNITIENCNFKNTGKFMWDYGLLWQIIVFPEDYTEENRVMAQKYFRNELIIPLVKMEAKDDRVYLNNVDLKTNQLIVLKGTSVCFYNDELPINLIRGKQYFVVESTNEYIKISEARDGSILTFDTSAGEQLKMIHQVRRSFMGLYAPKGHGPGKGAIDLVGCKYNTIAHCKISALGDAMHIHSSESNIFSNNHILGARMGAFFLAEFCKNSTITGNIVDGTNGSRVMSIEKSNEDVVVIGNTFRNGGRGTWINQPKNLIIKDNIFINNTTKGESDPWRGRIDYKTGQWWASAEIYFTTWEKGASYGPIILKDNIFVSGPEAAAAVQFEKNGKDIIVEGNIFKGSTGTIYLDESDTSIYVRNNIGSTVKKGDQFSKAKFGN